MTLRSMLLLALSALSSATSIACGDTGSSGAPLEDPESMLPPAEEISTLPASDAPADAITIELRVREALLRTREAPRRITVVAHDSIVDLDGYVGSHAEKVAAARVARSIEGVSGVNDNLVVGRADDELGDGPVAARVRAALLAEPLTKVREIQVESVQGVVELAGVVGSLEEKRLAAEIARSVHGVGSVQDKLDIEAR